MCFRCDEDNFIDQMKDKVNQLQFILNKIIRETVDNDKEKMNMVFIINYFLSIIRFINPALDNTCEKFTKLKNDIITIENTVKLFQTNYL